MVRCWSTRSHGSSHRRHHQLSSHRRLRRRRRRRRRRPRRRRRRLRTCRSVPCSTPTSSSGCARLWAERRSSPNWTSSSVVAKRVSCWPTRSRSRRSARPLQGPPSCSTRSRSARRRSATSPSWRRRASPACRTSSTRSSLAARVHRTRLTWTTTCARSSRATHSARRPTGRERSRASTASYARHSRASFFASCERRCSRRRPRPWPRGRWRT